MLIIKGQVENSSYVHAMWLLSQLLNSAFVAKKYDCVPIKLYLQNQIVSQISVFHAIYIPLRMIEYATTQECQFKQIFFLSFQKNLFSQTTGQEKGMAPFHPTWCFTD